VSLQLNTGAFNWNHYQWRDGTSLFSAGQAAVNAVPKSDYTMTASTAGDSLGAAFHVLYNTSTTANLATFADPTVNDTEFGFAGRLVFSPYHDDASSAHVAVSYGSSYDSDVSQDTSNMALDAAAAFGPMGFAFEYASKEVDTVATSDESAWNVEASYVLTGQNRSHSGVHGTLDGVRTGGSSAMDVGFTYGVESKDASVAHDGDFGLNGLAHVWLNVAEPVDDGGAITKTTEVTTTGLGAGYYVNDNVHLNASWARIKTEESAVAGADAQDGAGTVTAGTALTAGAGAVVSTSNNVMKFRITTSF